MLYGRLVNVGENLTDLHILGCELHKNAFGGRAPPRPAGGAISLPRLPRRYKGRGKERVGNSRKGEEGERKEGHERVWKEGNGNEGMEGQGEHGEEGAEGEKRVGKGEGGLDLDVCPEAPEFLITPLLSRSMSLSYSTVHDVFSIPSYYKKHTP